MIFSVADISLILSGKTGTILKKLPQHTFCIEKYIIWRENGGVWRDITIDKGVEDSVTHITTALL